MVRGGVDARLEALVKRVIERLLIREGERDKWLPNIIKS